MRQSGSEGLRITSGRGDILTQISGQMTIFDFLQTEDTENLDDMTDEYLMQKMYEATGLKFVYDAGTSEVLGLNYFKCKVKRREYECYFSTYAYDDHKRFISVGVSESLWGSGAPCDSLSEAIQTMKRYIERK